VFGEFASKLTPQNYSLEEDRPNSMEKSGDLFATKTIAAQEAFLLNALQNLAES
jgi:hypothetical protein